MTDIPLIFLGLFGFISILAIMLARLIDKPSSGRNFVFSFFIISLAIGFVTEMAQEDSMWIGVFRLDFAGLIIFASLLGICTEVVLITIYRGNSIAAIISGLLLTFTKVD